MRLVFFCHISIPYFIERAVHSYKRIKWFQHINVNFQVAGLHSWKTNKNVESKFTGSTEANVLAVRWRLWADLQTAGRMSFQCTYSNRLRRSDRRNVRSASKWQQKLLLQPEFSSRFGSNGAREVTKTNLINVVWIWIPLKIWTPDLSIKDLLHISIQKKKHLFLAAPLQDSCLFSFCPPQPISFHQFP